MKKYVSIVAEVIARTIAYWLLTFLVGTILTMIRYKDISIIMYSLISFTLGFCILNIIKRSYVNKHIPSEYFWECDGFTRLQKFFVPAYYILYTTVLLLMVFYFVYVPIIFSGAEYDISTEFELRRGAYMLLGSLPTSLMSRVAYTAINVDTFSIDVYNKLMLSDFLFNTSLALFSVIATLRSRAKSYAKIKEDNLDKTNKISRKRTS